MARGTPKQMEGLSPGMRSYFRIRTLPKDTERSSSWCASPGDGCWAAAAPSPFFTVCARRRDRDRPRWLRESSRLITVMELRRRTDGGGTEYPDGGCQEGTVWFSDCIDLVLLDRPRRRRRNRRKPLRLVLPGSFFRDDDPPTAGFPLSFCPLMPAVSAPGKLISLPRRLLCASSIDGIILW